MLESTLVLKVSRVGHIAGSIEMNLGGGGCLVGWDPLSLSHCGSTCPQLTAWCSPPRSRPGRPRPAQARRGTDVFSPPSLLLYLSARFIVILCAARLRAPGGAGPRVVPLRHPLRRATPRRAPHALVRPVRASVCVHLDKSIVFAHGRHEWKGMEIINNKKRVGEAFDYYYFLHGIGGCCCIMPYTGVSNATILVSLSIIYAL